MTSLAVLPAPIRRLFERIDAAPVSAALGAALEHWNERRRDRLFPRATDLDLARLGEVEDHLFVLELVGAGTAEWQVVSAGTTAVRVLMPEGVPSTLPQLANRRIAVCLRRLINLVKETGEPVAATFMLRVHSPEDRHEVLLAPLSRDGRSVDGTLGGLAPN